MPVTRLWVSPPDFKDSFYKSWKQKDFVVGPYIGTICSCFAKTPISWNLILEEAEFVFCSKRVAEPQSSTINGNEFPCQLFLPTLLRSDLATLWGVTLLIFLKSSVKAFKRLWGGLENLQTPLLCSHQRQLSLLIHLQVTESNQAAKARNSNSLVSARSDKPSSHNSRLIAERYCSCQWTDSVVRTEEVAAFGEVELNFWVCSDSRGVSFPAATPCLISFSYLSITVRQSCVLQYHQCNWRLSFCYLLV